MNNLKLFVFSFSLLCAILFVSVQKEKVFALFQEGRGDITTKVIGSTFPKTLIDVTGIKFTIDKPPQKIISSTLFTDHILSSLIKPSRIKAVTQFVDLPSISNIVGFYPKEILRIDGNIESILKLEPDLVFVSSFSTQDTVRYLLRSDIAVVRLSRFNSFADLFSNIRLMGEVTDTKLKAASMIKELEFQIDEIKDKVAGKKRVRVLYYDPNGYSIGGNSMMNEAISIAGGKNIAAGVIADGENMISEELAISLLPDIIIMAKSHGSLENINTDLLLKNKKWENVPAIKNKKVYEISNSLLRSISQYKIEGSLRIAKILHPEIKFNEE